MGRGAGSIERFGVCIVHDVGRPSIVAGDFNTSPESTTFRPFLQLGLSDAWRKLYGDKDGNTF